MKYLLKKKILLFAPNFFGYDIEIKKELENLGAEVFLYNERPSNNFFIKTIIRFNKKLITTLIVRYFNNIISTNKEANFDYVFIIKGEVFTRNIILKLKENFSQAKFILYLWDSIENYNGTKSALNLFDKAFTFDYEDSEKFESLTFRPLFFIKRYQNISSLNLHSRQFKFDLLFIGTVHSDRWQFLSKLRKQALVKNYSLFFYAYIQSPLIYIFRKLFDLRLRSLPFRDVRFSALSIDKTVSLVENSLAIIDIQHPKQTGLTMRSIEALGANRKLITTNANIKNYDLYNENNILIVDRNNPIIPEPFLKLPYKELDKITYFKYSIEGWIFDIFNQD